MYVYSNFFAWETLGVIVHVLPPKIQDQTPMKSLRDRETIFIPFPENTTNILMEVDFFIAIHC